jgi:hypothetical protein
MLAGVLSIDRCLPIHSMEPDMSTRHTSHTVSDATPVRVKTGVGGFGISLGHLIAIFGIVISGAMGFNSLRTAVETLTADSQKNREELSVRLATQQRSFDTAMRSYDERIHADMQAAKQLLDSEHARMALVSANTLEKVTNVIQVVDTLRPFTTAIPVIDQRIVAVERATTEFREAISEMRAGRNTQLEIKAELKELRSDIKALSLLQAQQTAGRTKN